MTVDKQVKIQYGTNCNGEPVVRVLLHGIELTSQREVDSLLRCLGRTIASLEKRGTTSQKDDSTQQGKKNRDRCILDIQMCDLNRHMEDLLRDVILQLPQGFDGLDIMGEDEPTQAARLELISNSNIRFLPPLSMSIAIAKILRDVLRGNQGRLDYLSLTSVPISRQAAKIIFEDGLKTTRRNRNLGGLMLRGCSFEDEPIFPDHESDEERFRVASPAGHLAQGLRLNTTLKFLDISLVFWTDSQLESILHSIVDHPTLTKVDLEGSVFGPRSINALKVVLQSSRCRIRALDLSQLNYVRDLGKERVPLDKAGLLEALEAGESLEQIILNHNHYFSFVDLSRIIRLLRRRPRICHVSYDDFIPDGTPRMKTIALRSTIRALLYRNRSCQQFIVDAARAGTVPSVWPHCLARTNRILRNDSQRVQALFPLVQAFFGVPGAVITRESPVCEVLSAQQDPINKNIIGVRKRKR